MEHLKQKLAESYNRELILLTLSNPRKSEEIKKYSVRPVLKKGQLYFQVAAYTKTQVFHENLDGEAVRKRIEEVLPRYKQVQLQTASGDTDALISKKGKASIRILPGKRDRLPDEGARLLHNRAKRSILEEGKPVPFLQDLGVMTAEGKIVRAKYNKYRQINRFLEFLEDVLPSLAKGRELTILDFGCGKSYLTFAVYYYLRILQGYPVRIIGLDLKKDVIRNCSRLAKKYGYDHLQFYEGSIEEFEGVDQVDMVITLHACDTATDYALEKAVRWGADVILSVPCCQHELNAQMTAAEGFGAITDYGLLKERFAALATDGIRAKLLESEGYETQILEFIDMEHTPKNRMIRAIRKKKRSDPASDEKRKEIRAFCAQFGFSPTLLRLLEAERTKEE